ncbi:MAG TPA: hypothetical protein VFE06_06890 [Acidobacteriaceae bacterium]|jgi:hypothetical protein|nr:hypothetical protein [Acidobacteriaceae bacterium]
MDYTQNGGERFYASFGTDRTATHFLYDAQVYVNSPSADVANLEMDMNETMPNGDTVIFGFQCDGWNSTWDYTMNSGTPEKPVPHWVESDQACNPRSWTTDTWHHVQVLYSRDSNGNVTYQSVWLDGKEQDIGVTVPSSFSLGWAASLLTNFQIDGHGAGGSAVVYVDHMSVSRW